MSKYILQDAFDFIRRSQNISVTQNEDKILHGDEPISYFKRVINDLPPQEIQNASSEYATQTPELNDTKVRWQVEGEYRSITDQYFLHLSIQAGPVLICQRCMSPFQFVVDEELSLELVQSADDLDKVDESGVIEFSELDKIVAYPELDIAKLVEDELILTLPYIPKHIQCDDQTEKAIKEAQATKPSPFAVLEKLKKN